MFWGVLHHNIFFLRHSCWKIHLEVWIKALRVFYPGKFSKKQVLPWMKQWQNEQLNYLYFQIQNYLPLSLRMYFCGVTFSVRGKLCGSFFVANGLLMWQSVAMKNSSCISLTWNHSWGNGDLHYPDAFEVLFFYNGITLIQFYLSCCWCLMPIFPSSCKK